MRIFRFLVLHKLDEFVFCSKKVTPFRSLFIRYEKWPTSLSRITATLPKKNPFQVKLTAFMSKTAAKPIRNNSNASHFTIYFILPTKVVTAKNRICFPQPVPDDFRYSSSVRLSIAPQEDCSVKDLRDRRFMLC